MTADPTEESKESWTVFRLPRSYWHCQLSNFDWSLVQPTALRTHVQQFVRQLVDDAAGHLILTGSPGIGKSHIGVGVYRAAVRALGTGLVTWLNVPAFCARVKVSYEPDAADPWLDIEQAQCLVVLDDLFGRDLSRHEVSQIVYRLIDTVYQNKAALLVTMNQSVTELQAHLASHEISRLLADSKIIPMTATRDYRRG